jgi:hypothetical protein
VNMRYAKCSKLLCSQNIARPVPFYRHDNCFHPKISAGKTASSQNIVTLLVHLDNF